MAYCISPGWLWSWRNWWNDWQEKPKYSEKTCPSAALSTTNPTCCQDANPGRRGGKPATNRLSYGTAIFASYFRAKYPTHCRLLDTSTLAILGELHKWTSPCSYYPHLCISFIPFGRNNFLRILFSLTRKVMKFGVHTMMNVVINIQWDLTQWSLVLIYHSTRRHYQGDCNLKL
jgi:hypothetical protein